MAILANSARGMQPRVHRAYRLEMSGRTLLTLLSLLALTGLVVFYLGVVTGKGLRDPNPPMAANAPAPGAAAPGTAATGTPPGNLTFNQALTSPNPQIEGLKSDQAKLSENTNKLVAQARQELELEEVPTKTPLVASAPPAPKGTTAKSTPSAAATAPKPAASVAAPQATAPKPTPSVAAAPPAAPKMSTAPPAAKPAAKPASVASGEDNYTVQVFSSTKQQNAQELMVTLKNKGFPAYLNQFQAEDKKTWYRVRVGKGTKAQAEAIAAKLKKDGDIKSPRVLQQ